MKQLFSKLSIFVVVCLISCFVLPFACYAAEDMDGVAQGSQTQQSQQNQQQAGNDGDVGAIGDYMRGYTPVDDEDMAKANQMASPITNFIGSVIGVIVVLASTGIFLITALDLCYIGIPFTRHLLTMKYQLVSDEALACAPGAAAPQQSGGMNGQMGGMNSQMGGFGGGMNSGFGGGMNNGFGGGMNGGMNGFGGGMNSMGGQMGAQQGQPSTKSCVVQYLKKRIVFIVVFTICTIILLSSAITGCGINLASLLLKILNKINGGIAGVSV